VGGELSVLEIIDRPKAKIHAIEDKQLEERPLRLFLSLVVRVRVERFKGELASKSP
jgi:hypothetical protein